MGRLEEISTVAVTAQQMRQIEEEIFAQGMPVASLMEKAATTSARKIQDIYPVSTHPKVGFLIGCGHNGGDGLVIARELFLAGYHVSIYAPLADKSKDLTAHHLQYAKSLGLQFVNRMDELFPSHFLVDALFGFGLTRTIEGDLKQAIDTLNQQSLPVVSIDLPSGIHTDTGEVLGVAVKASHTLCLGLWKIGLFLPPAIEYTGQLHLIDIGIPSHLVEKLDATTPHIVTPTLAKASLPLPRNINTHKYKQGHLLLVCGSWQYAGAAVLAGYGVKASGVGMVTFVTPASVKPLILQHFPWALVIGCQETEEGTLKSLPSVQFNRYDAIAFGMGVSTSIPADTILPPLLNAQTPLLIDADGLNLMAQNPHYWQTIRQRQAPTILTPHDGEFKRLFPHLPLHHRLESLQQAASDTNTIILLKGAKPLISAQGLQQWLVKDTSPALARGGSGDVLSGLLGGLLAQKHPPSTHIPLLVASATWLHQQAALIASSLHTDMGVDPPSLCKYILRTIKKL
ncbi:MAG: NAD(P)H-hydrate dehydratase [Geminocystis sp.]|nr:NAD(P)H-hydrate dehydratase [Geminocystis sp.]